MDETSRLFIAISLPTDVKMALQRTVDMLQEQIPNNVVRWVKPDNIHLTLRFLGDTAVSKIPQLVTELDKLDGVRQSFTLQLNQLGCFPNKKQPRVLWVGLQGEMRQLVALKQTVDHILQKIDFPLETRRYNPHLTIGRVKDSAKLGRIKWGGDVAPQLFSVTAVTLFQSELTPNGAIYTNLHTVQLQA